MNLTTSVLGHIFYFEFAYDLTLTLGRVYEDQKINGQSLYYFNPHMSFWSCYKSPNNKQIKMSSSNEGVEPVQ